MLICRVEDWRDPLEVQTNFPCPDVMCNQEDCRGILRLGGQMFKGKTLPLPLYTGLHNEDLQ